MRLAWLTDLHLPFVDHYERFFDALAALPADALVITGDIGDADRTPAYLQTLAEHYPKPIYFVYGNHDFYHGSVAAARAEARLLCGSMPNLHYLSDGAVIELTPQTALIGHDGWADGRFGNWAMSYLELNDYYLIRDLSVRTKAERLTGIQALAAEAAAAITIGLTQAMARYAHVIVATHVPPFREVCWHAGKIGDDDGLPHFSSKVFGEAILKVAAAHPESRVTVLCGHTHSPAKAQIVPNVYAIAGEAEYGRTAVQEIFEY